MSTPASQEPAFLQPARPDDRIMPHPPDWFCRVETEDGSAVKFIRGEVAVSDVIAVSEGGCASGAWMPAVTYWKAAAIMAEYGDDAISYCEEIFDDGISIPAGESWSGIAVYILSAAIETWCNSMLEEAERIRDLEPPDGIELIGQAGEDGEEWRWRMDASYMWSEPFDSDVEAIEDAIENC